MKKRFIPALLAAAALCGCKGIDASKLTKVSIPSRTIVGMLSNDEAEMLIQGVDKKLGDKLSKVKHVAQSYEAEPAIEMELKDEEATEVTFYENDVTVTKTTNKMEGKTAHFKASSSETVETIRVKQEEGTLVQDKIKRDKNPEEYRFTVDDKDRDDGMSIESILDEFGDFDSEIMFGRGSGKNIYGLAYDEEVKTVPLTADQRGVTRNIQYAIFDFKGTVQDATLNHIEYGSYGLANFDEAGKVHKNESVVEAYRYTIDFEYKDRGNYKKRSEFVSAFPNTIVESVSLGIQPMGASRTHFISLKADERHFYGSCAIDVLMEPEQDYEVVLHTAWAGIDKDKGIRTSASGIVTKDIGQEFVRETGKGTYDGEKHAVTFAEQTVVSGIFTVDYPDFSSIPDPDQGPTAAISFA